MALEDCDTAGQYTLGSLIGRGGCGVVCAGEHRISGQRAAIKILLPEFSDVDSMIERFVREARAVNRINHPNIVKIYEFGRLLDGRPFYAMEFLDGSSLRDLVRRHGAVPEVEMLELLTPICSALQAVHDAGYVHRDLKSSNVMVSDDRKRITLLDFGIAKLLHSDTDEPSLTSAAGRLGTPHVMAPEQINGAPIDGRTDIYALGILCYELLTARRPFTGRTWSDIADAHLNTPPRPPGQIAPVTPAVEAVVLRCLEKQPQKRFPTVESFLAALRDSIGGGAAEAVQSDAQTREAIGLLVEARRQNVVSSLTQDAAVEYQFVLLARVENALIDAGFEISLRTTNALLALRTVDEGGDARRFREQALILAVELHDATSSAETMAETAVETPIATVAETVCLAMTVHFDTVRVDPTSGAAIGGDLLKITTWPTPPNCGVFGTASALSEIDQSDVAPLGDPSPAKKLFP